jgi:BlaI family transcriptional regulator, penicillinase repressor
MDSKQATPTTAELEILQILWKEEPLTVKEIHEQLVQKKDIGYTTALKIMQNMTIKGLLNRKLNGKSHLYYAAIEQQATQRTLLDKFVESAFGGSASELVMQLLGNKKSSAQELAEIKEIIKQLEQNKP